MSHKYWVIPFFLLLGLVGGLATGRPLLASLLGAGVGVYLYLLDRRFEQYSYRILLGGATGGVVGFSIGLITVVSTLQIMSYFFLGPLKFEGGLLLSLLIAILAFTYVGLVLGTRIVKKMDKKVQTTRSEEGEVPPKVLDTSVIIDGRIAEIVEIGFLEGQFVVPKFIIKEMQNMADSGERLKRERGRRGLDILNRMRTDLPVEILISDLEFPHIPEVDSKLVAAAEELGAKIVTNDFNLNKVASLEGIKVLNINDLSNAVKPVFIPGETFEIEVIKEGEEEDQGVGYLEDGTMIVVEDGKEYVGETIDVTVTSVIQTSAGRMIFTEAGEITD